MQRESWMESVELKRKGGFPQQLKVNKIFNVNHSGFKYVYLTLDSMFWFFPSVMLPNNLTY